MRLRHWLEKISLHTRPSRHNARRSRTDITSTESFEQRLLLSVTNFGQYPNDWNKDSTTPLIHVNGTFYFTYQRDDTGMELFKSDGTPGGTTLVKDLENPAGNSGSFPRFLTPFNNNLLFAAYTSGNGYQLYKTDGTDAGTVKLTNASNVGYLTQIGNQVFFTADSGNGKGTELHVTDGTEAGTHFVKDIWVGANSSNIFAFGELNGIAYFMASDSGSGWDLWKSDGTEAGTSKVKEINANLSSYSPPRFFGTEGGFLYYTNGGGSIYRTDGTAAGSSYATLPITLNPAAEYTPAGGSTYFYLGTNTTPGDRLYYYNGTSSVLLRSLYGGEFHANLAFANGLLFFATKGPDGVELWKSDGTVTGTSLLKDIRTGSTPSGPYSSYPTSLKAIGNTVYFSANDGVNGFELWKSDGTSAGTVLVRNLAPEAFSSFPGRMTEFNGELYFATAENFGAATNTLGISCWRTDGTTNGTVMLAGNHAPIMAKTGNPMFSPIAQDTPPANNPGTLVKDMLASLISTGGSITDFDDNPLQGIAINGVNNTRGVWQFSINNGTSWAPIQGKNVGGTIQSLTGSNLMLAADDNTRIRYLPNPGTSGLVGISFFAWDRTSFVNGQNGFYGGIGQSASTSLTSKHAYLTVNALNSAPTLNPAGNPALTPIPANIPPAGNPGTLVSTIIASMTPGGGGTSDADPGYLRGLAVIGADQRFGNWQFSTTNGSSWNNFGTTSQSNALLLAWNSTTRIRFQPATGYNGIARFTFLAWDQTSGTNGNYANASVTGGHTAFSTLSDEARIVVGSPNQTATFGAFRNGTFYLDANLNRKWNSTDDVSFGFGISSDLPIVGDWDGDGRTDVGLFRNGTFYLDANGSRTFDGNANGDAQFNFGAAGDKPLAGDWNGDGKTDIGVWRNGTFYLDLNGNRRFDGTSGGDVLFGFGGTADSPVTGDWNGDGKTDVGVYRNGTFYLDLNGNRKWDGTIGGDAQFGFAAATDLPVTGDWNGDGKTDVGVFRNGTFYIDQNGNQRWDNLSRGDAIQGFAGATDIPLAGIWGSKNVILPASLPTPSPASPSTHSTSSNTTDLKTTRNNPAPAPPETLENLYKSITPEIRKKTDTQPHPPNVS